MNESEQKSGHNRMHRRRRVLIRRDDHIGEPIGIAFLGLADDQRDLIMRRLAEYLGPQLTILKVEISSNQVEVEIEWRGWPEEAERLAKAAQDLYQKGARRNAEAMFREALRMDPVNARALYAVGRALADTAQHAQALPIFKLAREVGGDSMELLIAIAQSSLKLGREAAAISFFERVLEIDSKNFLARRALGALGRKPATPESKAGAVRTGKK
ncbi:MAG TPA: tetratricopeptide repeat protein [Candidatus Binataceae bacterium]